MLPNASLQSLFPFRLTSQAKLMGIIVVPTLIPRLFNALHTVLFKLVPLRGWALAEFGQCL